MNLKMKLVFDIVALFCLLSSVYSYQEDIEKKQFKDYFIKTYKLRLSSSNTTNLTSLARFKRSTSLETKIEKGFDRFKKLSKLAKYRKVLMNGTPEEILELIVAEVWDRVGAPVVDKTFRIAGSVIGSGVGGAVGGFLGMSLGFLFPPLSVHLVVGGVFIGQRLGRILGAIGGEIASIYVNNLVTSKIITPEIMELLDSTTTYFSKFATSNNTCRSDICIKGFIQKRCKCISCDGSMEYSDVNGLSKCKKCAVGSIPSYSSYYRGNIGCKTCGKGEFGKSDGKCYLCNGAMEYSGGYGATACKKCPIGSIPYSSYYNGNIGCSNCGKGKFGKSDGKCYLCNGAMEYSDGYGATACKKCAIGSIPYSSYYDGNIGCRYM